MLPAPFCSIVHPISRDTVSRYTPYEAAFQTLGVSLKNPYDTGNIGISSIFADEEGNKTTVKPFYYRPFHVLEDSKTNETVSSGRPYFLLRYTPRNTGKYYYRTYLKNGSKQFSSKINQFNAEYSSDGFVIVSPVNRHFFQLSSGEHYYPIGHNLAWLDTQTPAKYRKELKKMASAGMNCTRIWISTWGINVDDKESSFGFNQQSLYLLDSIMESAHEYGIKVILVLTNHEDLNNNRDLLPLFGKHPEKKTAKDFFTDKTLLDAFKARLIYLTNRFSPYSSLMAFETGNELDYSTDIKTLASWNREISKTIRSNDINRHLVTTSLGFNAFNESFWNDSTADFAQFHVYFNSLAFLKSDDEKSADTLIASFFNQASKLDIPFFCTEFGFSQSEDSQSLNEIDKSGILLKNSLWSSLFNGMSGGAMNWWWDKYILPNKLQGSYSSFSRYLSNVNFLEENFSYYNEPIKAGTLSVMRGKSMILGRFSAKDNNWVDLVASMKTPIAHKEQEITFTDIPRCFCKVQWWDTTTGDIINEYTIIVSNGTLMLKSPTFSRDLALKVLFERFE